MGQGDAVTDIREDGDPLWVFAYGSLLWNPEFEPAERRRAVLRDFHRSFAMRSIHHRGTEAAPGLVLALDFEEGATCTGLALRVRDEERREVIEALRARELISSAYLEKRVLLETDEGEVPATAFVIDREHQQYCGGLPLDVQAAIIAEASGGRGPNADYLFETMRALRALGIGDPDLHALEEMVQNRITG